MNVCDLSLTLKFSDLDSLVHVFVQLMGDVFPELKDNEKKIKDIIKDEEESFENTLAKVMAGKCGWRPNNPLPL